MTKPNNEWEKEFDKLFPELSVIEGQGDEGSIHGYDAKPYVKDFISKTLQQQREEKIEKVKKLIWKRDKKDGEDLITMANTHNMAISDVLKIMEEK